MNILNYEGVLSAFYDYYVENRETLNHMEYQEIYYEVFDGSDSRMPYIYYQEAEDALLEIGVFEVLGQVRDYLMSHFGEVSFDWSDSCVLAQAYWEVLGQEVFFEGCTETGTFFREIADKLPNEEDDEQLLALLEEDMQYYGGYNE